MGAGIITKYTYVVGAEQSTAPTPDAPEVDADPVNLGFINSIATDSASTGSNVDVSALSSAAVRFTNASLVSIRSLGAPTVRLYAVLINATGNSITILDEVAGATAANRIRTGTGSSFTLQNNSAVDAYYDVTSSRWRLVGASYSGVNTGDVTLAAVGSSPNANGASLSGQQLTLQPADATNPGILSLAAQSLAGNKEFLAAIELAVSTNSSLTGADQDQPLPSTSVVRMTDASLSSVRGIGNTAKAQTLVWMNLTGGPVTIRNDDAGAAANTRIITGTGADLDVEDGASILIQRDTVSSLWRIIGGSGSGGGGGGGSGFGSAGFSSVKTANYTVDSSDNGKTILCNTSGGSFDVTMPAPAANFTVFIKDVTGYAGLNPIYVKRSSTEKFDDAVGDDAVTEAYGSIGYGSDGTDYFRLTRYQGHTVAGRGLFNGGYNGSNVNIIDYIAIPTTGNATDFGDLTVSRSESAASASATRGIVGGGYTAGYSNVIDYTTILVAANATDFGDLTSARGATSGSSSSTRSLFNGGDTGSVVNTIDYVTIASVGNATDFGDLTNTRYGTGALASTTRSVTAGGNQGANTDAIDYTTIASVGNATSFGTLTSTRMRPGGASNSVRGLYAGQSSGGTYSNLVDYVTIATTGNSTSFGTMNLTTGPVAGCANSVRACFAGGISGSYQNFIDYFTIASAGNGTDFGDLTVARGAASGLSNAHGGL